jgi:hypothetical protein
MIMQMNANRSTSDVTLMWSVSTFGKHLRTVEIILASLRTLKRTSKARILTLATMMLGLTIVPACNCKSQRTQLIKGAKTTNLLELVGINIDQTEG